MLRKIMKNNRPATMVVLLSAMSEVYTERFPAPLKIIARCCSITMIELKRAIARRLFRQCRAVDSAKYWVENEKVFGTLPQHERLILRIQKPHLFQTAEVSTYMKSKV